MSYAVRFTPESLDRLDALESFIAESGVPLTAARYIDAIVSYCETLGTFPHRGAHRDDLFPGLRVTHYRSSAVIAYLVDDAAKTATILGIFYGGQNYEAAFDTGRG